MSVKIKESARAKRDHVSRFDFTSEERTATITELIEELNIEYQKKNGEEIKLESLVGALSFIERITGQRIYDPYENLPLSTVKLIKLLYVKNEESEMHLLKLLSSPGEMSKPTMEFSTGTTNSRDLPTADFINSVIDALSLDIPKDKLELYFNLLGDEARQSSSEKFLLTMERSDDEIAHTLETRIGHDERGMANAYYSLSKFMDYLPLDANPSLVAPVNEAIFVHLETLALQHFIVHHKSHLKRVRLKREIRQISGEISRLCELASKRTGASAPRPFDRYFSLNNFHHVVFGYPAEMASLVRFATGLETRKKRLFENTVRARALLASYVFRSLDETDRDIPILSLIDIAAALCSFRLQQEIKTEYSPYWHGQPSQGSDPQRLFDKGLRKHDPHQHQGVFQIYYYRFEEYQAAFTGTLTSYYALLAFRLSRLDSYLRTVRLNSIIGIFTALTSMDYLCMEKAMDIAMKYPNSSL